MRPGMCHNIGSRAVEARYQALSSRGQTESANEPTDAYTRRGISLHVRYPAHSPGYQRVEKGDARQGRREQAKASMICLTELASPTLGGTIERQPVQWAVSWPEVLGHDVGIDLGGLHLRMAEQFLEHTDVHPVLQHMSGKTVAQGLAGDLLSSPARAAARFTAFCMPDSRT